MSITATLKEFTRKRDEWRIAIVYTDTVSGDSFEKTYRRNSITKKQLRDLARNEAASIGTNETTDVDIPLGTTIDVTPDPVTPPDPPTQDEIDEAAWFSDWRQLQQMQEVATAIPALATQTRQDAIAALQANLAAGWKNSYLGKI